MRIVVGISTVPILFNFVIPCTVYGSKIEDELAGMHLIGYAGIDNIAKAKGASTTYELDITLPKASEKGGSWVAIQGPSRVVLSGEVLCNYNPRNYTLTIELMTNEAKGQPVFVLTKLLGEVDFITTDNLRTGFLFLPPIKSKYQNIKSKISEAQSLSHSNEAFPVILPFDNPNPLIRFYNQLTEAVQQLIAKENEKESSNHLIVEKYQDLEHILKNAIKGEVELLKSFVPSEDTQSNIIVALMNIKEQYSREAIQDLKNQPELVKVLENVTGEGNIVNNFSKYLSESPEVRKEKIGFAIDRIVRVFKQRIESRQEDFPQELSKAERLLDRVIFLGSSIGVGQEHIKSLTDLLARMKAEGYSPTLEEFAQLIGQYRGLLGEVSTIIKNAESGMEGPESYYKAYNESLAYGKTLERYSNIRTELMYPGSLGVISYWDDARLHRYFEWPEKKYFPFIFLRNSAPKEGS